MDQVTMDDVLSRKLRDEGMQRAVDHADRENPSWSDKAMGFLDEYLSRLRSQTFRSEDIRKFAEREGLPIPPDKRAWGSIMTKAAKAGKIKKLGWTTASDPKVHKNPVSLWCKI